MAQLAEQWSLLLSGSCCIRSGGHFLITKLLHLIQILCPEMHQFLIWSMFPSVVFRHHCQSLSVVLQMPKPRNV